MPVGNLVLSSPKRSIDELQDLAYVRVRSQLGTIPGASAPPPIGGNVRTIVISANAKKLRQFNISGDQIVRALASGSRSRAGAPRVTLPNPQAEASELILPAD